MRTIKPHVLVADPPWTRGQTDKRKGAERHYPLMTTERIAAMPIQEMMDENSSLFLWATSGALEDALVVMKAWGFQYKSQAVWDKRPHFGLGKYFRIDHELFLYGTRGTPQPWKFHGQRSLLAYPRMAHSVKPFEQFTLIERVLDGPYLELFARRRPNTRGDWRVWGNEVDSDVIIPGYPVPSDARNARGEAA